MVVSWDKSFLHHEPSMGILSSQRRSFAGNFGPMIKVVVKGNTRLHMRGSIRAEAEGGISMC